MLNKSKISRKSQLVFNIFFYFREETGSGKKRGQEETRKKRGQVPFFL